MNKQFNVYILKDNKIIKKRSANDITRIEKTDESTIIKTDDFCLYCPYDYNYIILRSDNNDV